MRSYRWAAASVILLAPPACGGQADGAPDAEWVTPSPAAEAEGTEIHFTGTVRRVELEGGFYAIRTTTA